MSTIAIIPARGGSKRLPRKNIYPLFGKPLLAWSIEACWRSRYIQEVFVSTEDAEIAIIAQRYGAKVIERPDSLADDRTPKMEVIRHADNWYFDTNGRHVDILVSIQANSPELNHKYIDKGIELLKSNKLWEILSVGQDHIQNSAFRVMSQACLYNTFLSAHVGVVFNDCTDVHTLSDIEAIEKKYANINVLIEKVTQ